MTVAGNGGVGIGTGPSASARLNVGTDIPGGSAIWGNNPAGSYSIGVAGVADDASSSAIYGVSASGFAGEFIDWFP